MRGFEVERPKGRIDHAEWDRATVLTQGYGKVSCRTPSARIRTAPNLVNGNGIFASRLRPGTSHLRSVRRKACFVKSIEICAGGGGQALGLETAGFEHVALVEIDKDACATLRSNRPNWNVIEQDLHSYTASQYRDIDLFAGGVPCPPFSIAGKQLGSNDDRDLFPQALRLIRECQPKAVMLENVKGILQPKFDSYRAQIVGTLEEMGFTCWWKLIHSSEYGVSQLRPRAILVALREPYASRFEWPRPNEDEPATVGQLLHDEMGSNGWEGADEWSRRANRIAPTLVGGSKKHGGPDLGPSRAKKAWADLGVNGCSIALEPPMPGFAGMPRLTVKMAAMVQGFPSSWRFTGAKTTAYRQVGNAFPPPVAEAVGRAIREALSHGM